MHVAIDFDGTISRHPGELERVCAAIRSHGHRVTILTAGAGELPPELRHGEMLKRALRCEFASFNHLVSLEKRDKGKWCADNGVNVLIDDEDGVIENVRRFNPNILALKVV